jgi:hypothetical protein
MIGARFNGMKRSLQVENNLAMLNGNDAAGGETTAIAKAVYLIQNGFARVAWAQEVCMKRMNLAVGLVDRAGGCNKGLTSNLTTKHSLAIFVGRFTAKDIDLNGLEI